MFRIDFGLICWLLFVFAIFKQGTCLKDAKIKVPEAVAVGDDVTLSCSCNTEDDSIYAIKWYFGNEEFYRYVPREMPPIKFFHVGDITVDIEKSNQNNVVLRSLSLKSSGNYSCEISMDAPTFDTVMKTGHMLVVQVPQSGPILKINNIKMDNKRNVISKWIITVSFGTKFNASCVSKYSEPAVNFKWTVNGFQYPSSHVESNELETFSDIIIDVDNQILKSSLHNLMILRCETKILNFYHDSVEEEIYITTDILPQDSSEESQLPALLFNGIYMKYIYIVSVLVVLIISVLIYRNSRK